MPDNTESTNPPEQPPMAPKSESASTPPPRKRRKWILKTILGLIVAAVLLVALAPTIIGSSPVVSIILGKVNAQLNGKVEVKSLSLGWFTGIKLDGVQVRDDSGTVIARLEHAAVPMPLWKAATGRFALGDVVVDGAWFSAQMDAQGRLNFSKLVKTAPPPPVGSGSSAPAANPAPSKVPDVSGTIHLTHVTGQFSQPGKPVVFLTRLDGEVKIPDINQPITDHLTAAWKLDQGAEGTLDAGGTAAVIGQNLVKLDTAEAHQKLQISNLALATLKPFLPPGTFDTLDGVVGATAGIDLTGGKSAVASFALTSSQKIAVGGPLLKGDTFSTGHFSLAMPKLSIDLPGGVADWQHAHLLAPQGSGLDLTTDQGQLTVALDAIPQAILNLIGNQKPGSAGSVTLVDHFDIGDFARQLPHLIPPQQGVTIASGTLDQNIALGWTADKGTVSAKTDLTNITGARSINGQVKTIAINPIHLAVDGADFGGAAHALPDLRDLQLSLQSKFASAQFQGNSIASLKGELHADLKSLRDELSQVVDLSQIGLDGKLDLTITNDGDPTLGKSDLHVQLTGSNLLYAPAKGTQIHEPLVKLNITGQVHTDASATPTSISDLSLTLKTGSESKPTVNVDIAAPVVTLSPAIAADFSIKNFTADLAKLQDEFAAPPADVPAVLVNRGMLNITGGGNYSTTHISIDSLAVVIDDLLLNRRLKDGQQIAALANDRITINLAAAVDRVLKSDGSLSSQTVRIKTFNLGNSNGMFDLRKPDDGDLLIAQSPDAVGGSGKLVLAAQLAPITDIVRKLGQVDAAVPASGEITAGILGGTITLASNGPGKAALDGDLKIDELVVKTETGKLPAQAMKITLKAASDQANGLVTIDNAGISGAFINAGLTKTTISLKATRAIDMLQQATVQLSISDLKAAMALLDALSPPPVVTASAAGSPTAAKPAPGKTAAKTNAAAATPPSNPNADKPLVVDAGSVDLAIDIARSKPGLAINLTESTKGVVFHKGTLSYTAKPITLNSQASIDVIDGKTLTDQLGKISVTQLTGNLGIAKLDMPQPISVSQLSAVPTATGSVRVAGSVVDLTTLLTAMQGQKPDTMPYRGDYTLTESISAQPAGNPLSTTQPSGKAITLKGGLDVAHFQAYSGKNITFAEDLISVANDIALAMNGDDQSVVINSFTAAMKSSGACNVSIQHGTLDHLQSTRQMNLQAAVDYDLQKLWPIVQPMMGDQYKTAQVNGHFQKTFTVTGSYPANVPFNQAITTLNVDGGVAVGLLDYSGLTLKDLDVPFTVRNGVAVTLPPSGGQKIVANDGTLFLDAISLDMSQPVMRVSIPNNKLLLLQATINPLFAHTFMKNIFNNPVFAGAEEATGTLDLTALDCVRFPLGDLMMEQTPANDGKIDLVFSLTKCNIGLQGISGLGSALKQDSLQANINNATVSIAKGLCKEDMKIVSSQYTIGINGTVRLKDQNMIPLNLVIGPMPEIMSRLRIVNAGAKKYVPDTATVVMQGPVTSAQVRFDQVIAKLAQDAAKKAVGSAITDKLLGKNNNNGNNNNGNNNNGNNQGGSDNPLNDLINGLGRKKH